MFYLVCFDIVDNKDRRAAVKIIKGFGSRVQKSVFECPSLTEKQFLDMKNSLEAVIDNLWDTVRFYSICKGCIKGIEYIGTGDPPQIQVAKIV